MRQQRLWLALLFSLSLHLATLVAPGWPLPTLDDLLGTESSPQLEAHLSSFPARKAAAPSAPHLPAQRKPRQGKPPIAAAAAAEPVPEPPRADTSPAAAPAIPSPVPQAQQRAPDSAGAPPAAVVPVAPAALVPEEFPLPRQGRIRFAISRGDQGFVVGQALHRWSHDGKTYVLDNVTETTGIAALFRPARVTQTSIGDIGAEGLRPREFRKAKDGVAGDAAIFDWTGMKLALSAGSQREVALVPGAQDLLSMFYQLSAAFPWVPRAPNGVMVATGRKFERYIFELVGEEILPTRQGEFRTLHLRTAAGVEAIDVWSALDLHGLPLKIRYTDREGESFVQTAEDIEFEGMTGASGNR